MEAEHKIPRTTPRPQEAMLTSSTGNSSQLDTQQSLPKSYRWRPSIWRARPLIGIAALLVAVIALLVSLAILLASNGQPVSAWYFQPTVRKVKD